MIFDKELTHLGGHLEVSINCYQIKVRPYSDSTILSGIFGYNGKSFIKIKIQISNKVNYINGDLQGRVV